MNVYIYIHTLLLVTYICFIPVLFVMRPDTCYRLRGPFFKLLFFTCAVFMLFLFSISVSQASHSRYEQGRRCMHVGAFSGGVLDSSCF